MSALYKKPSISSYSSVDVIEELGPCQNYQYATINPSANDYIISIPGAPMYILGSDYPPLVLLVGDYDAGGGGMCHYRAFFSFDISSIHSTVVSATLKIYQVSTPEGSPYTNLGSLLIDHVNFGTIAANATVYDGNDLTRSIATTSNSADGWKEFDVKNGVQADIDAGRSTSQFRVRFTNEQLSGKNDIAIEDKDYHCGTTNKPELVVTYH